MQAVTERREREQQAAEHAAKLDALQADLAALQDTSQINQLQAHADAALDAYVAAMAAHNTQVGAIRDALQALGDPRATVDMGSYANGWGVTIGDVEVRRQRVQTNVVTMVRATLRKFILRGEINLERPSD